jgi:transposase
MFAAMATSDEGQRVLALDAGVGTKDTVAINGRCRLLTRDGRRVVSVCGVVVAHYDVGDQMSEALAMVTLVQQGMALQVEVARGFECSERTVRRYVQRYESGGLAALGRPSGYPKAKKRLRAASHRSVNQWKADGMSNREMARRLGVSEKAVRNRLRRLGWRPTAPEQGVLALGGADPNLSGLRDLKIGRPRETPSNAAAPAPTAPAAPTAGSPAGADPNLSGSTDDPDPTRLSLDSDPGNRQFDRVLACMGLLDDAVPLFAGGRGVACAGVLVAVPALVESGVFEIARDVYGSIGPAFYGLRTTLVTLLLMALLRIKRPEALKEHPPQVLGQLLGLDRAPEVKTLRRKLSRLALCRCAVEFGRALARHRVATRGHALGFLYVDGHVRAYHGKRQLPKTHLARMRLSMPATTDYWVNDVTGDPLFVVTAEANQGLVKMLPNVLGEIRALVGERRVTVVFDRGGWSPKLFAGLIATGFDILTYRKGRYRRVAKQKFKDHEATIDGLPVRYMLADQPVLLDKRKLRMRQVTRLSDDGHQTPVITSRWDLPTIEVAFRMFERWRQENFFKYQREEYALDVLVDYGVEPADPERDVPNPLRKQLDAELAKAHADMRNLAAEYGAEAFDNPEALRRTMRGFKIANAALGRQLEELTTHIRKLEKRRAKVPTRIPVREATDGEVIQLTTERKHLTNLIKMVAYQAESDLVRLVTPHYSRAEDEARTLVQNALAATGDIDVAGNELRVSLDPLSSPHRTAALAALCQHLNDTNTKFPGSRLRLHFGVKPQPDPCLAFPGPRPVRATDPPQPDKSRGG